MPIIIDIPPFHHSTNFTLCLLLKRPKLCTKFFRVDGLAGRGLLVMIEREVIHAFSDGNGHIPLFRCLVWCSGEHFQLNPWHLGATSLVHVHVGLQVSKIIFEFQLSLWTSSSSKTNHGCFCFPFFDLTCKQLINPCLWRLLAPQENLLLLECHARWHFLWALNCLTAVQFCAITCSKESLLAKWHLVTPVYWNTIAEEKIIEEPVTGRSYKLHQSGHCSYYLPHFSLLNLFLVQPCWC